MNVIEVNNLTLLPELTQDYLIVPMTNYPILKKRKLPLSMGRLDLVWVVKSKAIYTPMNLIPFVDLTQEQYDVLIEYEKDTLYRIKNEGEITKLYLNGIAYSPGGGEIKQLSLINDATIYMDTDGVLYKSIIGIDAGVYAKNDEVLYSSVIGTEDSSIMNNPAYGTITSANNLGNDD